MMPEAPAFRPGSGSLRRIQEPVHFPELAARSFNTLPFSIWTDATALLRFLPDIKTVSILIIKVCYTYSQKGVKRGKEGRS